jgi:hypothetical protein
MFALAGPASATTLATSRVRVQFGGAVDCHVTNITNKSVEVTLEVINGDGLALDAVTEILLPFQTLIRRQILSAWCRVKVRSKQRARERDAALEHRRSPRIVPAQ